ncbi:MAG: LamG-like jellyroll fold domain-containing protein [Bacteroidota bacterium]
MPLYANDTIDATFLQLTDTVNIVVDDVPTLAPVPDTLQNCAGQPFNFTASDFALDFDGVNDFVTVPTSVGLTNANAISVEAWINADVWQANVFQGVVVSKADIGPPTNAQGWILSTGNNGAVSFEVAQTGTNIYEKAESGPTMTTGTWHHIVGTFDGANVKVYIDGVEADNEAYAGQIDLGTSDIFIGKHTILPLRQFDGRIDEVRIWDYALKPWEIQARMNQALGGNEPGLLGYWDMEDGPNMAQATDKGPSNLPGNLSNMDPTTDWMPGFFSPPPPVTYNWAFGDGNTSIAPAPTNTYANPGSYTTTLSTTGGGCIYTDSVVLTVTNGPPVNLGQDTSICGAFTLTLDAGNPGAFYAWSNGAITQTITVTVPDTYVVAVTAPSGCLTIDSIIIASGAPVPVNLGPDTIICVGGTILVDPGPGYSNHVWSTGATTATLNVTMPDTFYLDATDLNGCATSDTIVVTPGPIPNFTPGPLDTLFCPNDPPAALNVNPPGGTFSGPGVTGNSFDPSQVTAPDTIEIIYALSAPGFCPGTDTLVTSVVTLPTLTLGGLAVNYCADAADAPLALNPVGGTLSGTGLVGTNFSPVNAGVGSHGLTYSFTDTNGCIDSVSQFTTVNALPVVSLTGLLPVYCQGTAPVTATGTPAGGTFSGPGMTGATFDPSGAGLGNHLVYYDYTDGNGCASQDSFALTVSVSPTAAIAGLAPNYCENIGAVALNGTPAGGTFSGPGVSGNSFDPADAGGGTTVEIVYFYQAGPNCSDADTQSVAVFSAPLVSLDLPESAYCETAGPVAFNAAPLGGVLSGPGVAGNNFDPQAAGPAAAHVVRYQFTDGNGCTSIDSFKVQVDAAPAAATAGSDTTLFLDDALVLNGSAPNPGVGNWEVVSGGGELANAGSAQSTLQGLPVGTTELLWTVTNGTCKTSDALFVLVRPFEEARGFSPNADGVNDQFVVEGLPDYPGSRMQILSRWGDSVFTSEDYRNDWTGQNMQGEQLPDDTYYFVLEVSNGKTFRGFVELRR